MIEPVDASTNGSGLVLAGLEFHPSNKDNKKKVCINSVYSHNLSFKKPKKPEASDIIINLSAGPLSAEMLQTTGIRHNKSWGSKMKSEENSINKILDIENLKNTVAKETSYIDSNTSEMNDMMDDTTLRKMQTRTYVLRQLPKVSSFVNVNDDNNELVLPAPKFVGSNQLSSAKSHVLKKMSFEPVKSFALNVELSAVSGKTISDKLILVKKFFYQIDGFGEATTPSKFFGIIRSFFISKLSLKKVKKLAIHEKIMVNNNVKQVNKHLDWVIVVKKILVDLLKSAVESVFSKFEKIQKALVKFELSEIADLVTAKWSVFMEKNSVHVAKAALLYTLPVDITVHDLSDLLEAYDGKTCFIGCNPNLYVHNRCAIVCFVDKTFKLAAIGSTPVFKGVNLHWASFFLACCAYCKQFGYISTECSLGENSGVCGKQMAPIICPVFFGEKTWVQVASGLFFCVVLSDFFGTGSFLGTKPVSLVSNSLGNSCLVLVIMKKLSFVELVSLASKLHVSLLVVLASVMSNLNSEMALNNTLAFSPPPFLGVVADSVTDLSSSSSKVLTTKVDKLEFKIVALEMLVEYVLEKLNCLCSGLGLSTFFTPQ
ncbi:hypothetical protein G9A89_011610 [Geosiphon pyriformis]|nr:hypothetical protein G9A89_011610 [Geosiphon pyriformis]